MTDGNGYTSKKEELKEAHKDGGGGRLRERPFDKVSTLSVDGMTMTPLWEWRVCQGHHTRELVPKLQQRTGKEGERM